MFGGRELPFTGAELADPWGVDMEAVLVIPGPLPAVHAVASSSSSATTLVDLLT